MSRCRPRDRRVRAHAWRSARSCGPCGGRDGDHLEHHLPFRPCVQPVVESPADATGSGRRRRCRARRPPPHPRWERSVPVDGRHGRLPSYLTAQRGPRRVYRCARGLSCVRHTWCQGGTRANGRQCRWPVARGKVLSAGFPAGLRDRMMSWSLRRGGADRHAEAGPRGRSVAPDGRRTIDRRGRPRRRGPLVPRTGGRRWTVSTRVSQRTRLLCVAV